MHTYIWMSLFGAFGLAAASVLGKIILRYRICDAGLITWLETVFMGIFSILILLLFGMAISYRTFLILFILAHLIIFAGLFLNTALQEGDASQVVPLLGLKIVFSGILAVFILNETASAKIWFAIFAAAIAVALFGMGRQNPAQGGRGRKVFFPIFFACLTSLFYSLADILAKKSMGELDSLKVVLGMSVFGLPTGAFMLLRKRYKIYKIAPFDLGLISLRAIFVLVSAFLLYASFERADGVIGPNIVFGSRGAFAIAIGYLLNKSLKIPIERQGWQIYMLRIIGTILLFISILIIL